MKEKTELEIKKEEEHIKRGKPLGSKELSKFEQLPFWKKILIILFVIFLICLAIYIFNYFNNKASEEKKRKYLEEYTRSFIEEQYNALKFDENNEAILKMDYFYEYKLSFTLDPLIDKEGNLCNGYIIVEKIEEDYEFNFDHICDQIDF